MALLRAYFCSVALGLPISFLWVVLLMPIVIVIEFIPISFLGIGTREVALFLFFTAGELTRSGLFCWSQLMLLAGPLAVSLLGVPAAMKMGTLAAKKT
jgi:uncharacterized membrane protein YbhN (UPF0104 family)